MQAEVLILGGGSGGISVAARLKKEVPDLKVVIVEPRRVHYYQPLWTLVGAGVLPKEKTQRSERDLIPSGVEWVEDEAIEIKAEQNIVVCRQGKEISYQILVVACGIELYWEAVKGLKEALGQNGVCSNYAYEWVDKTWEFIQKFKGGVALFTHPNTPIKCGGAPQKIMYLAEDYFRKKGIRSQCRVVFASATKSIFGVAKYARVLERIIQERGIETHFRVNLVEVRGEKKEAVFERLDNGQLWVISYDLLHVTPPMRAPRVVRESVLASSEGWVEVDPHTLQHVRYKNVFSLGDVSSLPTSKTGAAIRKQAPVLVANLLAYRSGKKLIARYDGYTSCPLVTRYGKVVLAEFDYEGRPVETFPFDQAKERTSMYLLKRYLLPFLYWEGMLKGRA